MTTPGFERLMVGRTLAGRYEVLELIGSGGMSVVFRGLDHTLGREVAVKVVSLAPAPDEVLPTLRERFRREAASAARIQHPNVVAIYDYGTDAELELDFIVMELLRGRDLKDALASGPMPQPEAVRILMDAARGVAAGHRAGILHRDVKPANVFLVGEHNVEAVRILDFGIAKALEEDPEQRALTTVGHLPHSPAYAAPEQLDASAAISPASDVYQLGLIGYEMLAGRRAYTEDERARIRGGAEVPLPRTEAWSGVPSGVCSVIHRALRLRPDERYPDAAAFAEALAHAQEHDATVLHVVSAPRAERDATQAAPAPTPIPVSVPVADAPAPRMQAPPVALEPSISGVPVSRPGGGMRMPKSPALWLVPVLLLLALLAWAATRGGDDEETPVAAAPAPADTGQLAKMDEEFLKLEGTAGQQSAAAPVPAGPATGVVPPVAAPGVVPPAAAPGSGVSPAIAVPPAPVPTGADVLARARVDIEGAVRDLNQAWVEGELDRHIGHYASRVDYYNSRRLPRAGVARDRRRDLRRYDRRQINVRGMQVQFLEPDRARVLVDKEWIFGGDAGVRQGRGTQEYVMKRDDDGKWYVVSEQLLTTNEARVPASD
ncbi:MAG TPA: serine/threonine-protein kinase [Longimicrobium sp.]|uniref:serine/threonine-protein kinase n=1 Tax=Longimicrobium sp. TaxID=2029185 RepID=UPI002ED82134